MRKRKTNNVEGPRNPRRETVSESLTAARKDYEYRAANGLLTTTAEAPSFQTLVRNKTMLQVKLNRFVCVILLRFLIKSLAVHVRGIVCASLQLMVENTEFWEARELELMKRMSRVEMDKWGKEMREETVKAYRWKHEKRLKSEESRGACLLEPKHLPSRQFG